MSLRARAPQVGFDKQEGFDKQDPEPLQGVSLKSKISDASLLSSQSRALDRRRGPRDLNSIEYASPFESQSDQCCLFISLNTLFLPWCV